MPSRMQQDLERKSQMPKPKAEEYSFKPKINEMKTAEDFQLQHQKFEAQLQSKK